MTQSGGFTRPVGDVAQPSRTATQDHEARNTDSRTSSDPSETSQNAPLGNPAVQAIADALTTPHTLNFGSVYVADRLRAEVIAMHVADVLALNHWEVRYVGPG